jgi:hypothetical protein
MLGICAQGVSCEKKEGWLFNPTVKPATDLLERCGDVSVAVG